MSRYFFELAYRGTDFFGWQRQPKHISVQETIEEVLTKINSNQKVRVVGCGRTDTGVHANHYVLHVDLDEMDNIDKYQFKLNCMLPDSIAISKIYQVEADKHARFHATSRSYRYYIHNQKNPFLNDRSWFLGQELDFKAMNEAAKFLLGKQDFTSLSKLHTDVKTNICEVKEASWTVVDNETCYFEITANRFLRNMVRATVGTLVDIGLGKLHADDMNKILKLKDRQEASTSAPSQGLFLWRIEY